MNRSTDEIFMSRCIQLAMLGAGHVAPNPMVGAVLVHESRIIGEGYHRQYGQPHAEVNCVNSVKAEDRHLVPSATMYVSLEPCAHYGKTPPCANLIVAERIPRVVIGCVDTFSEVAGKGISILQNAGVKVTTGVLEKECRALNSRFFTFHEQQRPYIILKWAQCRAGFMALENGQPVRISNPFTDRLVHRWRSEEMGILVGTRTALTDNPRLNNRLWTGNDPVRIVIDLYEKISPDAHLMDDSIPTLIFTTGTPGKKGKTERIFVDDTLPFLPQLLKELHGRRILSVLVEGGATTLGHFIAEGLWDEARVISGNITLPGGQPAPVLTNAVLQSEETLEGDHIYYYQRGH